jgi:mRNA interferase MazF
LVLAALRGDDIILCQITSQARSDGYAVALENADFTSGGLHQSGRIRPNRLFTADEGIVVYRSGHVSDGKLDQVLDRLVAILRQP